MARRSAPADRHRAACEAIRELRRERGLSPGRVHDLFPLSLSRLLEIQAELLRIPVQVQGKLFEDSPNRAA
jgi:hypothetical protein